ncbi:MAG: ArsR family transcriptional regulator, lead/cadmium/zinc/bismuth-responsive transcriptional [Pseudonocardiales bacterium]|nr:ArsR family transcriptional regulator, lead/cadmium/zinc/bismuth-responsive transcriptional [Pseudonocardiales bacterium]
MNNRSSVGPAPPPGVDPSDRDIADTAEVFGLLSDPGRLRLLIALRSGEQNVGRLAALSGLSDSATSHALRLLRAHRVVDVRRVGRMAIYRLADVHVSEFLDTALAHAEHTELIHPERGRG